MTEVVQKQKRGFALLSPERRKEIASRGGKAVPSEKRAFALNPALASIAGKKGVGKRKRAKVEEL